MSWRWMWVLMVVMPSAWAQRPPETVPGGVSRQSHVLSYDRSSLPGDIELLPRKTVLGYSTDVSRGFGLIHLTCRSNTNSANGACPQEDTGLPPASGVTKIALRFTEARSGLQTDVMVRGALQRAYGGRTCYLDSWNPNDYLISSSSSPQCVDTGASGTGVLLSVPAEELGKLVAGHWAAELILDLRTASLGPVVASYEFTFDLTITDHNAVSIYFPAFPNVSPLVALNAGYDPISRTIGGRTVLDMCLYDGLGSQAQYLGVTVRDTGTRPPGPSGFSLWHDTAGNDDSQRLDYTVTLDHNGTTVPLTNGVEEQLHGIDTAQLRLVMLPGMSQPVFCVPTPMTLDIPRVPISTKRSGIYWGDLKVELRVPTATP